MMSHGRPDLVVQNLLDALHDAARGTLLPRLVLGPERALSGLHELADRVHQRLGEIGPFDLGPLRHGDEVRGHEDGHDPLDGEQPGG
jgi:hypothetical protein